MTVAPWRMGGPLIISLHGVAAVKLDQVVRSAHEIQAGALYGFQENVTGSGVFNHSAAGDHVQLRETPYSSVTDRPPQISSNSISRVCVADAAAVSYTAGSPGRLYFPDRMEWPL